MTAVMAAPSHSCRQVMSFAVPSLKASQNSPKFSTSDTTDGQHGPSAGKDVHPGREHGQGRGDDEARADHDDQGGAAQPGPREPGAAGEGDLPHRVQRVLQRVRYPQRPDEYPHQADRERKPLLVQPADVGLELREITGYAFSAAFNTLAFNSGLFLSTMSSTVTRTSSSGKIATRAEYAISAARSPACRHRTSSTPRPARPARRAAVAVGPRPGWFFGICATFIEEDVPGRSRIHPPESGHVVAGHQGDTDDVLQSEVLQV